VARDWWVVLEVKKSASQVELKSAFRRLAKKRHPDHGGSHAAFVELNQAYQASKLLRPAPEPEAKVKRDPSRCFRTLEVGTELTGARNHYTGVVRVPQEFINKGGTLILQVFAGPFQTFYGDIPLGSSFLCTYKVESGANYIFGNYKGIHLSLSLLPE